MALREFKGLIPDQRLVSGRLEQNLLKEEPYRLGH